MEKELVLEIAEKYFPEVVSPNHIYNYNDFMQFIKDIFAPKIENDLEEILMSADIKFADPESALSILKKQVEAKAVLDTRELMVYKAFPCPMGNNCTYKPPEIVPHNEYMDQYLLCPFYHHEKDRRRLVLHPSSSEDFLYKANYQKVAESTSDTDAYSRNFFESLFHPIFYKLFPCKRKYCSGSYLCPFRHSEKEKTQWDDKFMKLTKKQRDIFLKEKAYIGSYLGSLTSLSSGTTNDEFRRGSIDENIF